jgi:hypothetical protein
MIIDRNQRNTPEITDSQQKDDGDKTTIIKYHTKSLQTEHFEIGNINSINEEHFQDYR